VTNEVCRAVTKSTAKQKAARQPGGLLSRENSSNGGSINPSELSGKNLMSPQKAVSRNFSTINAFVFNDLSNLSTLRKN
jgi:hypothetical protein